MLPIFSIEIQMNEQADVFKLIKDYCTAGQIKALLQEWQKKVGKKAVQIGSTKDQHIANLRTALETHAIPAHELHEMLRNAEENGDQHILYYLPRNKTARAQLNDSHRVADRLFGDNWETQMGFPRFDLLPSKYIWSDFRIVGRTWIAKLYGHRIKKIVVDRQPHGDDLELVTIKTHKLRHVCVIHWNGHSLEIRIARSDNSDSRIQLETKEKIVWAKLNPAITSASLVPWDLSAAKREMANEYLEMLKNDPMSGGPNTTIGYYLSDQQFLSPNNERIGYRPEAQEDGPSALALNLFKSMSVCPCANLSIHWSPVEELFDAPFTSHCGGSQVNELTIPSAVTPKALQYVTSRFRAYEDRAAGAE